MNTILVLNSKGGVGKTTVTTNLASYFAANKVPTTIMDYDPQGSSLHWLRQRSPLAPSIRGADASPQRGGGLRSLHRYVQSDTQQLIVDAPAGASRLLLQEMLHNVNYIIIPVAPSAIDIHATANFIKELLLVGRIRALDIQVAAIANRVRDFRPVYEPLERFLKSLGMPFLTRIRDSEVYLDAAESGVGIFEMAEDVSAKERQDFAPIVEWVRGSRRARTAASAKIVELSGAYAYGR